jgi:hypothetical protein
MNTLCHFGETASLSITRTSLQTVMFMFIRHAPIRVNNWDFWDMVLYRLVDDFQTFSGTCFNLQGSTRKVKRTAASSSKVLVNCNPIPERTAACSRKPQSLILTKMRTRNLTMQVPFLSYISPRQLRRDIGATAGFLCGKDAMMIGWYTC